MREREKEGFCLANCDGSIYAKCCRSLPKEISLNKISNFTNKSCLPSINTLLHTGNAMANSDGPTAMLLPSLFERFCSYNCDGLLEGQGQGKGKGQEASSR